MAPAPDISVIMPVYNAATYLESAIQSILAQTFTSFEFIIVDDGSQDKSANILQKYAERDERIIPIHQSNSGISTALNQGIERAQGNYLARMDADDIALPQRLEAQIKFLNENPDYAGIGSWVNFIDPDGDPIFTYRTPEDPQAVLDGLLQGDIAGLIHPAMMFPHQAVKAAGAYRPEYDFSEDYDLFTRLSDFGKLSSLPQTLLKYRQHLGSINAVASLDQRIKNKTKLTNAFRSKHDLPPIELQGQVPGPIAIQSRWVELALQEGEHTTARKHCMSLLKNTPFHPTTLKTFFRVSKVDIRRRLASLKSRF